MDNFLIGIDFATILTCIAFGILVVLISEHLIRESESKSNSLKTSFLDSISRSSYELLKYPVFPDKDGKIDLPNGKYVAHNDITKSYEIISIADNYLPSHFDFINSPIKNLTYFSYALPYMLSGFCMRNNRLPPEWYYVIIDKKLKLAKYDKGAFLGYYDAGLSDIDYTTPDWEIIIK